MAGSRKVIVTCAVTGAIHTPSMSPHLPVTAAEIAEAAIGAADKARLPTRPTTQPVPSPSATIIWTGS
jgi:hypothetical protein